MALTLATLDKALKDLYTQKRVNDMVYKRNPLLAMLPERTDFYGRQKPVPIRFGDPQNRAARFAYALRQVGPSATSSSRFEAFNITRKKNYGSVFLDAETVEAASADVGTFVRQAANEINGMMNNITRDLALDIYRDGTGLRGVIDTVTSVANSVITLTRAQDARHFEPGMLLWSAATLTGAVRSATADVPTVLAVNLDAGTITVNANAATYGSAWAPGDHLFVAGDAPNSEGVQKVMGLAGWIPATAPGSTPFFTVDRSVHPTRLGGIRSNGSSLTNEEAWIDLHVKVTQEGGAPDFGITNPYHVKQLIKELGSTVVRDNVKSSKANVGFKAVMVTMPDGDVPILADHNCPIGVGYLLQRDTWQWHTLGGGPRILGPKHDGLRMLRQATADAYEVRFGYYGELACDAPGFNGRTSLPE
jgi:hypothetical protein